MPSMTLLTDRVVQFAVQNPAAVYYTTLGSWWLGGLLSIFLPLRNWNKSRQAYYGAYGRYAEYENAQRNYEEAQNNNDDGNNGYYDEDGNYVQNENQNSLNCSWWQYKCRKQRYAYLQYQQQQDNNGDGQQIYTPSWYQFLGGKGQDDQREREEMGLEGDQNGGVKFVYIWSLLLFLSILAYGSFVFYRHYKQRGIALTYYTTLAVLLFAMLQYSLLQLVLVPQGVIAVDERDMEDSVYGWYGQWPVLLVYFEFAQCLFSGILLLLFGVVGLALLLRQRNNQKMQNEKESPSSDYVGI
jgi:hypothetical protein